MTSCVLYTGTHYLYFALLLSFSLLCSFDIVYSHVQYNLIAFLGNQVSNQYANIHIYRSRHDDIHEAQMKIIMVVDVTY